ncbi:hypothetical protein [Meiothermus rufus]|uniref:hypothetical protein n=1 Tax=Meiothermus rufus TaxID=604332 RepID=UPI00041F2CA8|nr:hypothetical protein [Meiothermus rufus]
MALLQARLELELDQALLQAWSQQQLAQVSLPLQLLRFPLGRLEQGQVRGFTLEANRLWLELRFASGPCLQLALQALGFLPEKQALHLRVEQLLFTGFRGAPVLNLLPGKVLAALVAQANRRLPGLLELGRNLELWLYLNPLLQKLPLSPALQALGLVDRPRTQVERLELQEKRLWLTLYTRV